MRANIPKGLGGGPQNMQALMRQVQKAQEEVAQKQEELDAREYDISAGGGVVNVKINGKREILAIDLKPEIVDPDDIFWSRQSTRQSSAWIPPTPTS